GVNPGTGMKPDPDPDQLFRLPGGLARVAEGCEAVKPRGRAGNLGGEREREGRRELRAGERDAGRPAGDRDGEQPEQPMAHAHKPTTLGARDLREARTDRGPS